MELKKKEQGMDVCGKRICRKGIGETQRNDSHGVFFDANRACVMESNKQRDLYYVCILKKYKITKK